MSCFFDREGVLNFLRQQAARYRIEWRGACFFRKLWLLLDRAALVA